MVPSLFLPHVPLTEFYENNKVRIRRCKWCKKDIQRIWGHLLCSCENDIVTRERRTAWIDKNDGSLDEVGLEKRWIFSEEFYDKTINFFEGLEAASEKKK